MWERYHPAALQSSFPPEHTVTQTVPVFLAPVIEFWAVEGEWGGSAPVPGGPKQLAVCDLPFFLHWLT